MSKFYIFNFYWIKTLFYTHLGPLETRTLPDIHFALAYFTNIVVRNFNEAFVHIADFTPPLISNYLFGILLMDVTNSATQKQWLLVFFNFHYRNVPLYIVVLKTLESLQNINLWSLALFTHSKVWKIDNCTNISGASCIKLLITFL